jgi:hypothetical protein
MMFKRVGVMVLRAAVVLMLAAIVFAATEVSQAATSKSVSVTVFNNSNLTLNVKNFDTGQQWQISPKAQKSVSLPLRNNNTAYHFWGQFKNSKWSATQTNIAIGRRYVTVTSSSTGYMHLAY